MKQNKGLDSEFLKKLIKAKKMEAEAFGMLIPEPMKSHMDIIGSELKSMLAECAVQLADSFVFHPAEDDSKEETRQNENRVNKVHIG